MFRFSEFENGIIVYIWFGDFYVYVSIGVLLRPPVFEGGKCCKGGEWWTRSTEMSINGHAIETQASQSTANSSTGISTQTLVDWVCGVRMAGVYCIFRVLWLCSTYYLYVECVQAGDRVVLRIKAFSSMTWMYSGERVKARRRRHSTPSTWYNGICHLTTLDTIVLSLKQ